MNSGISLPMAVMDFMPVCMFFISTVILQRDLYHRLSKGAFALLAAGSIMVFIGGFYKASWKMLYALNICDFQALDIAMFPMQGPGFLLVFISLLSLSRKTGGQKLLAVPLFLSNMPFIIMQVTGLGGTQTVLASRAFKMKKYSAVLMYICSFIFMLLMGYLGSKFDDSSSMHWLAQMANTVSQGTFLAGTLILHREGGESS